MAPRRSSLLLLGAVIALFGLPSSAFGQTPPTNDTVATPGGWRTTPYVVTLAGSDAETAVDIEYEHGSSSGIVDSGTEVTISTQGAFDFRTRAIDEDVPPNASNWRVEPLWIDTVDPTDASTPATTAAASGWHLASTSFEVRAVDITSGVDHVEWSLDGAATQSGPNGSNVPLSVNGPHLLRTRAVDVAGNVSDWTDHVIRIDAVAPADTTALPTGWRTAPVDVTVKGTDAHSGVDEVAWVVDGGAPSTASPEGQFTISADGSHTVQTLVRDVAGNESGWAQHTVNIDTTVPTNLTDAPDDWVQAAHVEVKATDAVSGVDRVEWQIDGGPWVHGPSGSIVHFTTTGEYQLRTRARDVAGNVSTAQLDDIQIDAAAPTNTTTAPVGQVSNPYQVAVTGTDVDSGVATVEWQVDGGTIHSGASGDPATVTGGGQHTLKTRVIDLAGNASSWRTDTIDVNALLGDNVLPVDTTTGGSSLWRKTAVTVTVQAVDAGSGVDLIEYRIPGFISGETATTATFQVTQEGNNLLETRVTDKAGNRTTWRQQRVKVDFTDPTDAIDIPNGWQGSNSFELAATDAHSGVDEILYTVNGGPEQSGDPGDVVTVGADGTYVIESRVTDNSGRSSAFTTRTLKVDTLDPVNTSAVPGAGWLDLPFELALSGTDLHLDTMQWRLDGGTINDGGTAVITEDGEYDLETRAVDEAGNDSGWRLNHVQIDGTAPENTTPAAPTAWRNTPYSVVVAGDDGLGSGVDFIERTINGGAVSTDPNVTITGDGVHTLRTRISDVVGHVSDWREEAIKIDTAAPAAALACSAAADAWTTVPASCNVTATDALSGVGSATLAGADGGTVSVADGAVATVSADGTQTIHLDVVDAAGNAASAQAVVNVDRTAPVAGLSCVAADGRYSCRADAADGTSGLAYVGWSVDGGAFATTSAGGSFTVAKGQVRVRAVDVAGNALVTDPVTLAAIPANVKVRISSVPVYLKGHKDADSMLGALNAVRSASGTVSVDLRPLAIGRGKYQVEIRLKSGKHSKRFKRTYKVGRTGALPRISASLSKATAKTTITLTVRKQSGKRWRKHAGTRLVLKK